MTNGGSPQGLARGEGAVDSATLAGAIYQKMRTDIVAAHYRLAKVDARLKGASSDLLNDWERANRVFHDALVSACRSEWLQRFRRLLQDQSKRYRRFSLQESASFRAVAEEHDALMQATLSRDTALALDLIARHIRATAENVMHKIPAGSEPSDVT